MSVKIPFRRELEFTYRELETIAPGIRRVVAENPGPFTLHGTGTYIIGSGKVAVIDPGPADSAHIDALVKGLEGEEITHVLVTHTHMDHSPGCALLREHTNAKTYAYGPHGAGKLEAGVQVEEGGDMDFDPDVKVRDGDIIEGEGWSVECVYTPGHTSNHICFQYREQQALFTGDPETTRSIGQPTAQALKHQRALCRSSLSIGRNARSRSSPVLSAVLPT